MKFRDLVSISSKDWLTSFLEAIEENGASKKSRVAQMVIDGKKDEIILSEVYESTAEKTKKTFNQTISTLYKEFLTYLLINHREYPDVWLAELRKLLAKAEEANFLSLAEIVERVFSDCEAHDHQIGLYHLLQDHHFQNKYKPSVYSEYSTKLRTAISQVSDYTSIEEYYLKEDLTGRKKKGKWNKSDLDRHSNFYGRFFGSDYPDKTRIRARLFWLKTVKMNDYFNLSSIGSQQLSSEAYSILRKKPFLYFNLAEIIEFDNISYQAYTSFGLIEPSQLNNIFGSFFEKFDDDWLYQMYPRIVQALITTQVRYYNGKAGLQFIDDPVPLDPDVEKGLRGLIPMVQKIRNRPSMTDSGDRLYGLETEALCRLHLPGYEERKEAIRLLNIAQVQEQQNQHVSGAHVLYNNLIQGHYYAKHWDELLEEIGKYKRFVKAKGEFNPLITKIIDFNEMIGKLMLREIDITPKEIEQRSKELFKQYPKWYNDLAAYSIKHLKLD